MRVEFIRLTKKARENKYFTSQYQILVDGVIVFNSVGRAPEEDGTIDDGEDVYDLYKLFNQVYRAGLDRRTVECVHREVTELLY